MQQFEQAPVPADIQQQVTNIANSIGTVPSGETVEGQISSANAAIANLVNVTTIDVADKTGFETAIKSAINGCVDGGQAKVRVKISSGISEYFSPGSWYEGNVFKNSSNYGNAVLYHHSGAGILISLSNGNVSYDSFARKSSFSTPEDKKITRVGTYFTERDAFKARCVGNTIGIFSYVNITTQVPAGTVFADIGFSTAEGYFLFYSSPSSECVVNCSGGKLKPDTNLATGYYYVIGSAITII